MKNPFLKIKGLSKEAKAGVAVALCSVIFLGAVTGIGIAIKNKDGKDVALDSSLPIIIPSSTTIPSSSSSKDDVVVNIKDTLLERPFKDEDIEIKRYYFDKSLPEDDPSLEKAMYMENGRYISSVGLDFAHPDKSAFDVFVSAEGTVASITPNDKTFGNIVTVEHPETGLITLYASLGNIDVKLGQKLTAGTKIGTSGMSTINKDFGQSLHYEVLKDGVHLNPSKLFGKKLGEI